MTSSLEPTRTSSPTSDTSPNSNSPPSSSFGTSQADSLSSTTSSGSSMTLRDYQTEMQDYHRGLWREASWVHKGIPKSAGPAGAKKVASSSSSSSSSPELKVANP